MECRSSRLTPQPRLRQLSLADSQFVVANCDGRAGRERPAGTSGASSATATLLVLLVSSEAGHAEAVPNAAATVLMAKPVSAEAAAATINRMLLQTSAASLDDAADRGHW